MLPIFTIKSREETALSRPFTTCTYTKKYAQSFSYTWIKIFWFGARRRAIIIMCLSLWFVDNNYFSGDWSTGSCHRFRFGRSGSKSRGAAINLILLDSDEGLCGNAGQRLTVDRRLRGLGCTRRYAGPLCLNRRQGRERPRSGNCSIWRDRRQIHRRIKTITASLAHCVEKRGKHDGNGDNWFRFTALPDWTSLPCTCSLKCVRKLFHNLPCKFAGVKCLENCSTLPPIWL